MESLHGSVEALVKEIKEEVSMLDIDINPYSFVATSAYDTAWLAMVVADSNQPFSCMFKDCLNWVLNNQTEEGFWGECDAHGNPTIESLPATLACVIALQKWHLGINNIKRGLDFVHRNLEKLLGFGVTQGQFPRWFTIIFPGMIELARKAKLQLAFPSKLNGLLSDIFYQRQRILETEELVDSSKCPPLLSYLEALPSSYEISEEDITMNLSGDGSLFQSPAATARAFMATGNEECLAYLQSLVGKCANNGVPPSYPMDEGLIKLCVVNQLHKLGLADHFTEEIEANLAQIYRDYKSQESVAKSSINKQVVATQLQKDSLAFRLLRMHGYTVSPWHFCWFLNKEVGAHIEDNYESFSSTMLDVYRATDFMFPGEYELKEARSFSRKMLEKVLFEGNTDTRDNKYNFRPINLKKMIEHELGFPWVARLDHSEHRMWIEEKNNNILWAGKASFNRLSPLLNEKLIHLAVADYEFRQSIYRTELEEVKRWTRSKGLSDIGFGREKTTYCYFAIASSILLPYDSEIRKIITKSAVVITVADDFYDMEGSLDELNTLTDAVSRWDGNGLSGHSQTIFDALDDLVREIVAIVLQQQGTDITNFLQQIWYETFGSWHMEAKWSKGGILPSMGEYLGTGMISIAAHTLVLPASFLINPSLKDWEIKASEYEKITQLLMVIPRLANDIQSYQKEQEEGKMNYVLLYLRENPGAGIEVEPVGPIEPSTRPSTGFMPIGSFGTYKMWIEEKNNNILWASKASFNRLSPLLNEKLIHLAVADYEFRQSIYRTELEEVKMWTKSKGLSDMGFGREKTSYCYFAIAFSIPLPYDSDIRKIITKSAVVITVADDFYDMEEIVAKVLQQQGTDITNFLQQIWYETFGAWHMEAKWSKGGFLPSMGEYLGIGMISIAAHTLVLPASFLMNPSLKDWEIKASEYEKITQLLMVIPRLANDIQSYQFCAMELSNLDSIQALVKEIKEEMFSGNIDLYSFVSPSAYDTAWLAMIPSDDDINQPMFKDCLDWVLHNQAKDGYWGECDAHGNPTIESLPATLACLIALKKWNVGTEIAEKGLDFIEANTEKFQGGNYHNQCPRWFAIVFPGMIELARKNGLELDFPNHIKGLLMDIFFRRQEIFETEELADDDASYPPLLSYLEALPSIYTVNEEAITMHLSNEGSLFRSPSATARAFMATGNMECLAYLKSLVRRCVHGVPPTYPMDEELIKLGLANQILRLGLAEHFTPQIQDILAHVYRNYKNQEEVEKSRNNTSIATQLHKGSLAFRLLRMHGYNILPRSFCWFLNNEEVRNHIEKNYEYFSSVMLNVYKATDLMFPEEYELEEARSFSRKLLEKVVSKESGDVVDHFTKFSSLQRMIEHELSLPWVARLDHLEHRAWIEENDMNALLPGKTSFHRVSRLTNEKLVRLAVADYELRQSIYKNEMAELKSWWTWGLSDMGFGREKSMYCYFAVASSLLLPYDSDIRLMVAKSAILITVADDFFDMEGSLNELNILSDAVKRWDGQGLSGHGETIFLALDDLVRDTAAKHLQQQGIDITSYLQQIWYETFASWLVEAKWSRSKHFPSMDEYLGTGMTSIAAHTLVLPASCLLKPSLPNSKISPAAEYETLTKLVMLVPRLLNDIQSYQKEMEDGKMNSVLLYMKENPEADIDDSIAFVRNLLEEKRKELLKHSLMDGLSDLPIGSRHLHLSCMKVFQMFFNSSNRYDSNSEMLQDIQKAIYIPVDVGTSKPLSMPLPPDYGSKKELQSTITSRQKIVLPLKYQSRKIIGYQTSLPIARRAKPNMFMIPNLRLSFA
ncbi:hypothetical protein CCACVL1_15623 [Corchorus capsularis]|uniref:Uncharacterized protein n=1 Tax=Corchorus capsularis TaxID=210143 RepID=A0A1R3I1N0_COCAP|nr:hypothetical protein CCACVL1_15623 [Corchorus capsularis]